ncbi:Hydrophobin [Pleurotus pulmonarius]
MRLTPLLTALVFPLLTVLATPVAPVGEAEVGTDVDVAPRQISLNPASSCPIGQLWCCVPLDLVSNSLIAGLLVTLGILDPTGINTIGLQCTPLSWPFQMSCSNKDFCCDADLPLVGLLLKLDCRSVNPLL